MPSESDHRTKYHQLITTEQAHVQDSKHQSRLIHEYDHTIFLGTAYKPGERTSFFQEKLSDEYGQTITSVETLLQAIINQKQQPISWVDMGGGNSIAMRQAACDQYLRDHVQMTSVDLLLPDLTTVFQPDFDYLVKFFPFALQDEAAPTQIQESAETVTLPQKANLITAVESIQYLNDPLTAICNWYNQLADNGWLIIATEHKWSSWIRLNNEEKRSDEPPAQQLVSVLHSAGIPVVTDHDPFHPGENGPRIRNDEWSVMAVQKKPGTHLKLNTYPSRIWVNQHDYKATYYHPTETIFEVTREPRKKARYPLSYYERLNSVFLGRNTLH